MVEFREAIEQDVFKGLFELLQGSFTRNVENINKTKVIEQFNCITSQNSKIIVAVAGETIIGTAKVLIEYKLHNNLAKMAHIEDVCVNKDYQNVGIGKQLVQYCIDNYCLDCYKIVLSCKEHLEMFYNKNNFNKTGISMTRYTSLTSV